MVVKIPKKLEMKSLLPAPCSPLPAHVLAFPNQLPGVEVATTWILHLEGKEIFGSMKRKLDLPLGDDGDSHRLDKVNFLQPRVQTRSKLPT
jgi:hypothetical protein